AFAQLAADKLGVPIEHIRVVQGDTDVLPFGSFTGGSRAITIGANTIRIAAERIIEKAKHLAGDLLEAAAADIEFADGTFTVAGTDKAVAFAQVAAAAYDPERPSDGEFGLSAR